MWFPQVANLIDRKNMDLVSFCLYFKMFRKGVVLVGSILVFGVVLGNLQIYI